MKSSRVPHKSLNQSHATFMPDAAQAISRCPLDLSWCRDSHQFWRHLYVFDTSSDGSLALVSLILNWSLLTGPFPQRSPPWLLTTAAWGVLKPAPASRLRGAIPSSSVQPRGALSPTNERFLRPKKCCDIVKNGMISQVMAFLWLSQYIKGWC